MSKINPNSKIKLRLVTPIPKENTNSIDHSFDIIEASRELKNLVANLEPDLGDQIWRLADRIQLSAEAIN